LISPSRCPGAVIDSEPVVRRLMLRSSGKVSGRNRLGRKMIDEGIQQDPEWKNSDLPTAPCDIADYLFLNVGLSKSAFSKYASIALGRCCDLSLACSRSGGPTR